MANPPTGGSPFDFQANPDAVEGVDYIDGYHTIRAFDIMDGQLLNFFKLERALRNLLRCSNYFPCLHAGRVNGLRFSIDTSGNVVVTDSDGTTYTLALTTADHGTLTGLGDDDHIIYIKADGSRAFTGAQAVVETDGTTPGLKTTADATTGIRLDGTNGIISMIIGGTAELIIAEGKITIPGLLDPTGLELTPAAANPGGTAANTLWADSGAGNRFKIGANTVAYLSEVGTGDLLAANNLSDLASDDTAIANLVDGATSRVPSLTDTFPYKDAGDATGGKGTIQQIFDRIDDLNTASLGLSSPIAAFESGGKKTTPTAIYNLLNSLTAETAPAHNDKVALYDASASQTDAVTIANLFGHGKAVVIEYTGSGVSGKTVTLTGINRAHFIVLSRDASGSGPSGSWPNGGTGTINAKYYADGSNWTEWSLSAPAAGTSQVLTINGTNGAWNSSGITYRLIVVGTPT